MSATFKACRCGRTFTAEEWAALPGLRFWPPDMGREDGWTLEQRDCPCGSSLTIDITNEEAAKRGGNRTSQ